MFQWRYRSFEGEIIVTRKAIYSLLVLIGLSACDSEVADPYGATGWKDSEDLANIQSVNPNGDTLAALRLELFEKETFIYTLMLENTAFGGACEISEGKTNDEGLTPFSALIVFEFPESNEQTFSIDANLMLGPHKDTGVEKAFAFFLGEQLLPETAIDAFTSMNKLDMQIVDECDSVYTRNFNVSGDLREMLTTLDQRKNDARNKEVDEAFQ